MRITGGTLRGRTLPSTGFTGIRPTTDRVRETLFAILTNECEWAGLTVLDLCAGTGALGFEALSRGAKDVTFVERHAKNARLIEQSAQSFGLSNLTRVYCSDVLKVFPTLQTTSLQFSLVFCDPPYHAKILNSVITKLDTFSILAPDAIIVLEHDRHEYPLKPESWEHFQNRTFGDTIVDFFRL